jgi:hypothetical protein
MGRLLSGPVATRRNGKGKIGGRVGGVKAERCPKDGDRELL